MKKLKIVPYAIVGGLFGFVVHIIRHSLSGVDLFSSGPHVIEGVLFTLVGMIIGGILFLVLSRR